MSIDVNPLSASNLEFVRFWATAGILPDAGDHCELLIRLIDAHKADQGAICRYMGALSAISILLAGECDCGLSVAQEIANESLGCE